MKKILILSAVIVFASCSAPADKTVTTDTVVAGDTLAKGENTTLTNNTPTVSSLCFLHTEGIKNQDTTSIEFVVQGSKVTGQMNWLPYEKDSRKGTLNGEIKNGLINATWSFMQEGMKDTMNVAFKLAGDDLTQKPLKFNAKTGRQQTDQSTRYTLKYRSANKVHR